MPRFSVVLPTVDRSAAIRHTIDSVLGQSERDWELIVVSDASVDDTDDIVRAYADPRIELLRLPERAGHPGPPRNLGLARARGEFIAYLDHDDRWQPDHLTELGALLDTADGARLASTGAIPIDSGGRQIGPPTGILNAVWSPELQTLKPIFEPSRVGHQRGVAEAVGGWGCEAVGFEDWDLWLRLADHGERFTTSSRPTTRLLHDWGTRRHAVPMCHELVLGHAPSIGHAVNALHLLTLAPIRARVRELYIECAKRWYTALQEEGELVIPREGLPDTWEALWDAALPDDTLSAVAGAHPTAGGAVVCQPLPCTTAEHAARIERIVSERLDQMQAFIRRVVGAGARLPPFHYGDGCPSVPRAERARRPASDFGEPRWLG